MEPTISWLLFSPDAAERLDAASVARQARAFFDVELRVEEASIAIAGEGAVAIESAPVAEAAAALALADEAARAIGGAGFDALLKRARRVWFVRGAADDARALLVSAVLASVLLAPIVPPGGGAIFGVRGARARLEALARSVPEA